MDGGEGFSHPVRYRKRPPIEGRFAHWLRTTFKIPSGMGAGQPFALETFQMDFIRQYLAQEDDGPLWRSLIYSTPRKLGKTTLLATVFLGRMCEDSPIHLPGFAGAVAAPSEKHSGYIEKAMKALMETAGRSDQIRRRHDPKPGIVLIGDATLTMSTGTRAQGHGADLDLAVVDEAGLLAQNQGEMLTGFFDALTTRNGQLILTGTRGDSPAYNDLIDRPDARTFVCLHAAAKDDDPGDPAVWHKANPGLGSIKPRRFMADAYEKAKQSGSFAEFEAWQLNKPLTPGRELLLDYDTLRKAYRDEVQTIPGEPVHIGLDLGGSASMTAATVAYEQSGVVKVLGAFPGADMDLLERGRRDLVGDAWHRAAMAGELLTTSGSVSDLQEFFPELVALIGPHPVRSLSCDRYRDAEARTALAKAQLAWPTIFRGTGPKDGNADILATRRLFLAGAVSMKRSLLLEVSLAEADVRVSTTGAMQLAKSHQTARIDVASSLVLACSALLRARDEVRPVYEVEVL